MPTNQSIAQEARTLTPQERDQVAAICDRLYANAQIMRNHTDIFDALYASAVHGSDILADSDSGLAITSDRVAAWLTESNAALATLVATKETLLIAPPLEVAS